jgi:hypothetical protein
LSFPGVGLGAPNLPPADEDTFLGVVGGSKLGLVPGPGVPFRAGLSGLGNDGRVLGGFPIPFAKRCDGDSERLRDGVGGLSWAGPVGEGRFRSVGVGGALEEEAEFRFVARASGTKIPELR